MKKIILALTLCALVMLPLSAMAVTFYTPAGSTLDSKPVSASADFILTQNTLTIVLTNLQANPTSVIQNLSDLKFAVNDAGLFGSLSTSAGNQVSVSGARVATPGIQGILTGWQLVNNGGVAGFYLDGLVPKDVTGDSIVDNPSGPMHTIIGPGPYSNSNGSIAGNGAHNPFLDQNATFILNIPGLASTNTVSGVIFSFGTAAGNDVPAVPIPGSLLLLGSGLLGLVGIRRKLS